MKHFFTRLQKNLISYSPRPMVQYPGQGFSFNKSTMHFMCHSMDRDGLTHFLRTIYQSLGGMQPFFRISSTGVSNSFTPARPTRVEPTTTTDI